MTGPDVSRPNGAAPDVGVTAGDGARDGAVTGPAPPLEGFATSGLHVVVAAGPDALPDWGAALEVLDHALETWGATGEIVQTGSPRSSGRTVAQVVAAGHEPVVVPGLRPTSDDAPTAATSCAWTSTTARPPARTPRSRRPSSHVDVGRPPARPVRRTSVATCADAASTACATPWTPGASTARTRRSPCTHYGADPDQHAELRLPRRRRPEPDPRTARPPGGGARPRRVLALALGERPHGAAWPRPRRPRLGHLERRVPPPGRPHLGRHDGRRRRGGRRPGRRRRPGRPAHPADLDDLSDPPPRPAALVPLDLTRVVARRPLGGRPARDPARRRPRIRPAAPASARPSPSRSPASSTWPTPTGGGLGDGAVADALGGAGRRAVRPTCTARPHPSTASRSGRRLAVVCGLDDELLGQSRAFARAARAAGDDVVDVAGPGDHFAVIDPRSSIWREVVRVIERHGPGGPT